ncbi:MAG TPA: HAD-IA family hydrolase [Candidatus Saccharimonadia bacterium]|nr:HAD-IA family hydrolase [Candidatus Saccharimonadia bacterium]
MSAPRARLIAVDVMDTLVREAWMDALEQSAGLSLAEINRRQDPALWRDLEAGAIDEAAYWRGLHAGGVTVDPTVFHQARRQGYAWLPGARELLADLRAAGHTVVLASNYTAWIEDLRRTKFAGLPLYVSYQIGVRKPSLDFFAPLLRDHDAAVTELILIDDSPPNVDAITRAGGTGILHHDTGQTRTTLQQLGILT